MGNLPIKTFNLLDRKAVVELLLGPSAEELWDFLWCVYLYSPSSLPSLFPSFIVYTQLTFLPSPPSPPSPSLSLPSERHGGSTFLASIIIGDVYTMLCKAPAHIRPTDPL